MIAFEDMSITNRAASLAIYELLGDANLINTELDATGLFRPKRSGTKAR